MSIIDKANEYILHPAEEDEGYEVTMRRSAYAKGYKDALEDAISWLKEHAHDYIVDIGGRWECKTIVGGMCWADLRKHLEG